jgi:cytochrome P450
MVAYFDLKHLTDEFYQDPYPTYHALRSQNPVYALPDGGLFVTSHRLVREVYRDTARFSSDKKTQFESVFGADSPLFEHHTTALVFRDPPLHTQVRRAIGNALSQRMIEVMRGSLEEIVDRLLDDLADREKADLISDFAGAIPVEIIGDLLGVPADERGPLRAWSLAILRPLEVDVTPAQCLSGNQAVVSFIEYLHTLIERTQVKKSHKRHDILSRLLSWRHNGQGLTPTELYHQCIFLLNAGHETTTNLIGNGIELLIRYPDQRQRLLDRPALISSTIEEILRFESSNQLGNRTTLETVTLGNQTIAPNSIVTLCIGAANRDPDVFPEPDRFDITRSPNPHLAFGAGIHTCAGLHVARLEGQVALAALFKRFPKLVLTAPPVRDHRARFRGFLGLNAQLS